MKQAILLLAAFLSLTTAAQQTGFPIKNVLPAYKPVKFDLHKNLKSPGQFYINYNSKEANNFSLTKNAAPETSFKTLQNNLSDDKHFFQLQQKKTQWTDFSSGILNSYSRQLWFENKNNVQQRWMVKKMKGKQ